MSLRSRAARFITVVALALVTCLVGAPAALAEPLPGSGPDFAAIDDYLRKEMAEVNIPGLAVGIVHGDEVVHLQGLGQADPSGLAVTPQTPFILASASKSFTALAIMQLVDSGKVQLDAPVRRYLPDFRIADEAAAAQITVRHLLNHTSGLTEASSYDVMLSNDLSDDALENRVRALRDLKITHAVGAEFEYTDANYDVLGLIIQTVSGQSYESYIQERIFAPLDMSHSFTAENAAQRDGLATGHRSWFGYPEPFRAPYSRAAMPSSYLISSAEDITHFLAAQLNGGTFAKTTVLSPEGVAAMHKPAVREGDKDIFYGMGWESRSLGEVQVIRHKGTNANFFADMVLDPEGRWGVVILTNFDSLNINGGRVQGLTSGVINMLRGQAPPEEPMPHHPILASVMVIVGVATLLMLLGIVRSVVLLRRWQAQPARRPRGKLAVVRRIVVPFAANLGWGVALLAVFPRVAYPLAPTLLIIPDVGYLVLGSAILAITWAILRTVLTCVVLFRAPHQAPIPPSPSAHESGTAEHGPRLQSANSSARS